MTGRLAPLLSITVALALGAASAAPMSATQSGGDDALAAADSFRRASEHRIVGELMELLRLPNVAADRDAIRANADWIMRALEARGVQARLLETEGSPYVLGELKVPGARRTLMFYCHYDGQPADPSRWIGHAPWEPVVRNGRLEDGAEIVALPDGPIDPQWRIYARSSSDDRGPIVMLLSALDALRAADIEPTANIKFLFEGDEEAGSPHMNEVAERYREELAADVVFFADGPKHPSGRPTLTFGARGIATVQLTVYGPTQPLHSGHYGNWAPNPIMRLAELLTTMRDDAGNILIDGYDDQVRP
ncbi:MAG: M20/M25/M40 family metallo-hydrolase, partial [Acidobacteriota bacterium]